MLIKEPKNKKGLFEKVLKLNTEHSKTNVISLIKNKVNKKRT